MKEEFKKFIKYSILTLIFGSILYKMIKNDLATPKSLGEECCECWKDANSIQNETKRLRATEDCYSLTRDNMRKLQEMGVDKDWADAQVSRAQKEFDVAYESCK